jgi:hypothetical protein
MLRRSILAGVAIALLTVPAVAQFPTPGLHLKDDPKTLTPEERAKQKAIDDAYRAATKKIPDQQVANDPWGGVRPNPSKPKGNHNN